MTTLKEDYVQAALILRFDKPGVYWVAVPSDGQRDPWSLMRFVSQTAGSDESPPRFFSWSYRGR